MLDNIFDSHSHYDDEVFDEDRDELLSAMPQNGVANIISCGADLKSTEFNMHLSEKYYFIYFAAGIHPECLEGATTDDIPKLKAYLSHPKCVAVGEIGLDYHYDIPRALQAEFFEKQLQLAKEVNMPVIVHDREAHGDTLELLKKYKPRGVLHCFSGSMETANEILKLGMYIGVGGSATFKGAKKTLEVAAAIPLERLLLETDSPYLTPVPHRGERNDSRMIKYVAEKLGEARNMPAQKIIDAANKNTHTLFNI